MAFPALGRAGVTGCAVRTQGPREFIEILSVSRVCAGASWMQSFWYLPKNLAHSDLLGLAGAKSSGKTTPHPSGTCRHSAIRVEGVIVAGAFHGFLMQGEKQLCQGSVCIFAFLHACSQSLWFWGLGPCICAAWWAAGEFTPVPGASRLHLFCWGLGSRGGQEPVSAFQAFIAWLERATMRGSCGIYNPRHSYRERQR